jgi:thiol-disulfide isomerase/thioredoxin
MQTRIFRNLGLAVLFVAAILAWVLTGLQPLFRTAMDRAGSVKAPAWQLKALDGRLVKSSNFAGKVVILDFWATWCAPCKAEIPGFIELQREYGDRGLAVVGVSVDDQGSQVVVKDFATRLGINYPVVLGDLGLMKDFGGTAIPTTVVLDRSGNIVARHIGFTSKETFENEIKPLL